jgi:hypothetical protein
MALFFALGETSKSAATDISDLAGAEVFAINPIAINRDMIGFDGVVSLDAKKWGHYLHPDGNSDNMFPICVRASQIDERIAAQSSAFTLHGFLLKALNEYQPLSQHIRSIRIPATAHSTVRRELTRMGYTKARAFPELATISDAIKTDSLRDYERWRSKVRD